MNVSICLAMPPGFLIGLRVMHDVEVPRMDTAIRMAVASVTLMLISAIINGWPTEDERGAVVE